MLLGVVLRGTVAVDLGVINGKLLGGIFVSGLDFVGDTVGNLPLGIVLRGTVAVGVGFVGEL